MSDRPADIFIQFEKDQKGPAIAQSVPVQLYFPSILPVPAVGTSQIQTHAQINLILMKDANNAAPIAELLPRLAALANLLYTVANDQHAPYSTRLVLWTLMNSFLYSPYGMLPWFSAIQAGGVGRPQDGAAWDPSILHAHMKFRMEEAQERGQEKENLQRKVFKEAVKADQSGKGERPRKKQKK